MEVESAPPEPAHLFKSVTCEVCGERVMEPRARISDGSGVFALLSLVHSALEVVFALIPNIGWLLCKTRRLRQLLQDWAEVL